MAAELPQVPDGPARWRFAVGCARTAVFPPRDHRAALAVTGGLALAAVVASALVTAGLTYFVYRKTRPSEPAPAERTGRFIRP